jgi:hypothetical protein
MSTNKLLYWGLAALILLSVISGASSAKETIVNLVIDLDSPDPTISPQNATVFNSMNNLMGVIDSKGLNATIFVSGDMASYQKLAVTSFGSMSNHELALNGVTKDEMLGHMTYAKQEGLLKKAKDSIDAAYICGTTPANVAGFRPQSFSQNNETFKVLQSIGIQYDAGFKAGVLYLPGHMKDTWPYPIENYSIYAVPVSTFNVSGEAIYLSDRYVKEDKAFSASKWYDLLASKFDESAQNGEPMVVIFNNLISGSGDYYGAYKDFIDYATSKNARFVTTLELVNTAMAKNGNGKIPALAGAKSTVCPTCGQKREGTGNLSIGVTVTHKENCTNCNESSMNATKPK